MGGGWGVYTKSKLLDALFSAYVRTFFKGWGVGGWPKFCWGTFLLEFGNYIMLFNHTTVASLISQNWKVSILFCGLRGKKFQNKVPTKNGWTYFLFLFKFMDYKEVLFSPSINQEKVTTIFPQGLLEPREKVHFKP